MEKRRYKGMEAVPLLGFGAMRLPMRNSQSQEIDGPRAREMVEYAMGHGVNYFDTAYIYHNGFSELFLGEALSGYPRDSYYLSSKLPPWPPVETGADIRRIFDEQKKRLRTEYFDFYLIHNYSSSTRDAVERLRFYDFLHEKREKGEIRRLGFSMHDTPATLAEVADRHTWDFAMIQLNYLDWTMQNAKRQYEVLTERGLPVMVMEPARGGALVTLCPEALEILKKADPAASAASWALRFPASLPNVLVVLSGMSSLEQLRDNVNTFADFQPLSGEELETIDRAVAAYRLTGAVPCTACRYCMPCPLGVDIPGNIALYNVHANSRRAWVFCQEYRALDEKEQAGGCAGCGECMRHCPQNIDIPRCMKTIAAFAEEMRLEVPDRPAIL